MLDACMAMPMAENESTDSEMGVAKPKLEGYEFWEKTLGRPRYVVAPMVDQSELPWRLLSRRHGAQLCYTPMFHASVFIRDQRYRRHALESCEEDRPLIVQFCANDPEVFVEAAKLAQDHCEAVDLNLGCPQSIAKRGHYGAYLQDDWDVISSIVSLAHKQLSVPVTCKIRIFRDVQKTVRFAQMLEGAGCQLLTVHGRTREMKGPMTGLADWTVIKAIKDAVKIPVFANGNVQSLADAERCMAETGVDGVMSAEGNLHNPALFEGANPPALTITGEYLDLVKAYPCPLSYVRGHLFKLCHHSLLVHSDLRIELARAKSLSECENICNRLRARCEEEAEQVVDMATGNEGKHPHWLCQPYFRPTPEETEANRAEKNLKRPLAQVNEDVSSGALSKKQLKKRVRNPRATFHVKSAKYEKCAACANPRGQRCVFAQCRACCKHTAHKAMADCPGHNLLFKSKQERKAQWEAEQRAKALAETTVASSDEAPLDAAVIEETSKQLDSG